LRVAAEPIWGMFDGLTRLHHHKIECGFADRLRGGRWP
jgi:hypothetical protein